MFKQFAIRIVVLAAALAGLVVLPIASASAAPSPWWRISTGSRPSNLWRPGNTVQELTKGSAITLVRLEGIPVACVGSPLCAFLGMADTETAAELQAALESPSAYGPGNVEVAEEPISSGHFVITNVGEDAGRLVATLETEDFLGSGSSVKLLQAGGSGRLVVTLTNVGDAALDAKKTPLTIEDELPQGVVASEVIASTSQGSSGSVECLLDSETHVTCIFKDTLPSYEAIEVEVFVSLTGEPPAAGSPGEVTASGANAPAVSAEQKIKVSPEPTTFGLESFYAGIEEEGGEPATQAGGHPLQFTTALRAKSGPAAGRFSGLTVKQPGLVRSLRFQLPAGLVGNARAVQKCSMADYFTRSEASDVANLCPDASAVGVIAVSAVLPKLQYVRASYPVFNLVPGEGEPARFGFLVNGYPVLIDTAVDSGDQYRIRASVKDTTQLVDFLSTTFVLWGTPGDSRHDTTRGWGCAYKVEKVAPCARPAGLGEESLLRMPVACNGPLGFSTEVEPWNVPSGTSVDSASIEAPGMNGCNQVPFDPGVQSSATSKLASSPSGFDFRIDMPNHGLSTREAIAEGQAKKVEVTLPEGMTINPSEGEGLVGCSPAEYARESASLRPGEGCPDASKIGTVKVSTPLLQEEAQGALYVATPYDNPFGSLLSLYIVARIPERGIVIKQAGVVKPDPATGQLTTTFDNLPQIPFTSFTLHFKEGGRAPLVTPSTCGKYDVVARFTPWSAANPDNPAPDEIITKTPSIEIERGVDGGTCPMGGVSPFHPGLLAGTINNAAGKYSPFSVRLTRNDGEQEFTNFSIKLPPGVVGKLAGIPFCSDAAITAARGRTGPNGGQEELDNPSCPAASQVGRTLVGAGVGGSLTYVPGKVYLAGPYRDAPLSVVAITAAKVGPFDLGTVVIREALRINPETAEVSVDPVGSDPIPHIIQGIPVHARDIRIYVDRPEFVLNPTSCERTSTASTVLGSGLDFGSSVDDSPVTVTSPFQAADCASLGFRPRLELSLRGKTNRGANPALKAVLRPRVGDANAARISVALPHSEFLDQGHIRTICTRVQFKAGAGNGAQCPKGAIYGHAKAWTPLFDKPLEGPIFLRSSEHPLPDLVLALHGLVDIQAVGRIDSVNGGIRNTFDFVPDAPITKVVVNLQGGKKSLLQNSTNICRGRHNATVKMEGHNGKLHNFQAPLRPKCPKKHAKRH